MAYYKYSVISTLPTYIVKLTAVCLTCLGLHSLSSLRLQSINQQSFDNKGMTLHIMSLNMGSMMSFIVGYLFIQYSTGVYTTYLGLNIPVFQWIFMSYGYGLIQNETNVVTSYSYDHCLQPCKRIFTKFPLWHRVIATTIEWHCQYVQWSLLCGFCNGFKTF